MADWLETQGNSELLAKACGSVCYHIFGNTHFHCPSGQISQASFKESVGVYQRKHFHLCCVFFCPCVNVCVWGVLVIIPSLFVLSEAHRVCDEQGVSGLSQTVSSGWLPSTSASCRIRCSMCGELLVRPALSIPQKVLLQWLWTHLPSPS